MFVAYLTIYSGNLLPPFYIGSTSLKRFQSGYHGSVNSKAYKQTYREELKNNPHLFDTCIISTHATSEEAREYERKYQVQVDAVKSSKFFNMSLASIDGFHGRDVSGKNNPMYGNHSNKGKAYYNDGVSNFRRIPGTQEKHLVEGYLSTKKMYYNDGINQYFVQPKHADPSWVKGAIRSNSSYGVNAGRKYYNDGIKNYMLFSDDDRCKILNKGMVK